MAKFLSTLMLSSLAQPAGGPASFSRILLLNNTFLLEDAPGEGAASDVDDRATNAEKIVRSILVRDERRASWLSKEGAGKLEVPPYLMIPSYQDIHLY
jgi:hypothetical protein